MGFARGDMTSSVTHFFPTSTNGDKAGRVEQGRRQPPGGSSVITSAPSPQRRRPQTAAGNSLDISKTRRPDRAPSRGLNAGERSSV